MGTPTKSMKTHKSLGYSIEMYPKPTYIDEYEESGKIKVLETDFINKDLIYIDITKNWIRVLVDGDKSQETIDEFKTAFQPTDTNKGGWNPSKGPMAVLLKTMVEGEIRYWPMGYTHRCNATNETDLIDIPAVVITIVNDTSEFHRKEIITDLYVKEQVYERAIQYDATSNDIELSLQRWKEAYTSGHPNWNKDVTKLEEYLENKIKEVWSKSITDSLKKKIAELIGENSTWYVTNYSTYKVAQNFMDKIYNGKSNFGGIGNIKKEVQFASQITNTVAQQIVENDGTWYKPIFYKDDLLKRDWFTIQKMATELVEEKSDTKIMLFLGVGGGSLPTDKVIDSRRKSFIEDFEGAMKSFANRDKINIAGWLPSDTDDDSYSILNYDEVKRSII